MGANPIQCIFNQGSWPIREYYNSKFFWFCYRLFLSVCDTKIKTLAIRQSQRRRRMLGNWNWRGSRLLCFEKLRLYLRRNLQFLNRFEILFWKRRWMGQCFRKRYLLLILKLDPLKIYSILRKGIRLVYRRMRLLRFQQLDQRKFFLLFLLCPWSSHYTKGKFCFKRIRNLQFY